MSQPTSSRPAVALAGLLGFTGTAHLVRPHTFDAALPDWLPGTKRAWAVGSGVAELVCGALVALPSTRRLGGLASAALFVVVFPGNVHMAVTARTPQARAVTLARLPLQVPLVLWALRAARS
ncbi:DoxX family protein [Microlunatus antarcticus]